MRSVAAPSTRAVSRLPVGGVSAAAVEAVLDFGLELEVVGAAGIVEVDAVVEGPLVEDVAEGVHRIVGLAVPAREGDRRQIGGIGHPGLRLGRSDPLEDDPAVRAVGQGEGHRLFGGPGRRHLRR